MTSKPRLPGLPARSRSGDRDLDALIELAGVWKGDRGDILDRVVTLRDLGADYVRTNSRGFRIDLAGGFADNRGITPSALTALTANGAFLSIILTWAGATQSGYSYTELWRATSDDLGTAVLVATSVAPVYADQVSEDAGYYYWVRAVSTSNNAGPFNAVAGTYAETAQSVEAVHDALTASTWQASHAYGLFEVINPTTDYFIGNVKVRFQATTAGVSGTTEPDWSEVLALGITEADGSVVWRAVEAGKAPFIIGTLDGKPVTYIDMAVIKDAAIESAKILSLAADKIVATSLAAISANLGAVTAGSLSINNKFIVDSAGNTTIRSGISGARLEIRNDVIKVYDSAGTLRVKLGNLNA